MILDDILQRKEEELQLEKKRVPQKELLDKLKIPRPKRDFKESIHKADQVNLIAEVKKASPSRGIIREDFDPVAIARTYEASGAKALSVLTDEPFFKGKLSYIGEIRDATTLPILRKDFIIDEYQVYQSAIAGSDAVLLITSILAKEKMAGFLAIASELQLDCLVEVHTEEDMARALEVGSEVIGINNRDLSTFKVSLNTTEKLIGLIPEGKVIASESGIKTCEDVMKLTTLGVDAVLIGEAFLESHDVGARVKEIMGY